MKSSAPRQPAQSITSLLLATSTSARSHERKRRPFARSLETSTRRFRVATVAVAAAALLTLTGTQVGDAKPPARRASDTGFSIPFSGPARYEYLAPTQATDPSQINLPIGQKRADMIARKLGLKKKNTLTETQYLAFITGQGHFGDVESAKLADESVRIFINTNGNPLCYDASPGEVCTVLGSYGLFVNNAGMLMSLANPEAPTRLANDLLKPFGYVNTWLFFNDARDSLFQLYTSAYPQEAIYGFSSQQQSDPWQLVTNTKGGESTYVGMSMAPALWLTNFALLYTLNPEKAAEMPAYWTPIPAEVADAILASENGQVLYSEYASYFE